MGGLWPAPSPAGDGSANGGAPLILLAEPGSGIERALVKRWLQEAGVRPSAVFPLDGPGLERSLAGASPDTVITAARVAWLPRERDGERRVLRDREAMLSVLSRLPRTARLPRGLPPAERPWPRASQAKKANSGKSSSSTR